MLVIVSRAYNTFSITGSYVDTQVLRLDTMDTPAYHNYLNIPVFTSDDEATYPITKYEIAKENTDPNATPEGVNGVRFSPDCTTDTCSKIEIDGS